MRVFSVLSLVILLSIGAAGSAFAEEGQKLALAARPLNTQSMSERAYVPPPEILAEVAAISVVKGKREMYLLDNQNNILRTYKISLGFNPVGNKMSEGDGKTPEGTYKIDFRNPNSEYFRSIRISYPSAEDRARSKRAGFKSPGGDIFIHGTPPEKSWMFWRYSNLRDWTLGCVGLSNKDMTEVWNLVQNGTPVKINP